MMMDDGYGAYSYPIYPLILPGQKKPSDHGFSPWLLPWRFARAASPAGHDLPILAPELSRLVASIQLDAKMMGRLLREQNRTPGKAPGESTVKDVCIHCT